MKKEDILVGSILILIGITFSILFTFSPNFQIMFSNTRSFHNIIVLIFSCGMTYIPSLILVGSGLWMIIGEVKRALWLEVGLVIYLAIILFINYSIVTSYIPIVPPET